MLLISIVPPVIEQSHWTFIIAIHQKLVGVEKFNVPPEIVKVV